jgi:hypothetical protein
VRVRARGCCLLQRCEGCLCVARVHGAKRSFHDVGVHEGSGSHPHPHTSHALHCDSLLATHFMAMPVRYSP